jgi:hypothetical protein
MNKKSKVISRMNDVDKVIASTTATAHLFFSLGTFQIGLQVADLYYIEYQ